MKLQHASPLLPAACLAVALHLLNACTTGNFNAAPVTRAATTNPCALLPLKNYPPAETQSLAAELAAAPPGATWPDIVGDYSTLRAAVRACDGN